MLYRWQFLLSFLFSIWVSLPVSGQTPFKQLVSFPASAQPLAKTPGRAPSAMLGSPLYFIQDNADSRLEGILEPDDETDPEEEAEETDEVETDRDSFTPAITTAGRRRLIVESAWTFIDNRNVAETHSFPEYIARYGVTDRLELRLGWNYEVGGEGNSVSGGSGFAEPFEESKIVSESQIVYGIKSLVSEQSGWLPQSIVILQAGTPTSGPDTATAFVGTYAFGWQLPNRWKWDSSMRYSLDSEEGKHFSLWAPSTVLKRSFGERWNAHIEYFGIFADGSEKDTAKHFISPGVHYLITSDLEIGVRLGCGLNEQSPNFFANIGGGYRF